MKYTQDDIPYTIPFSEIEVGKEFILVYGQDYYYERDVICLKVQMNSFVGKKGNCLCWDDFTIYSIPDDFRVFPV